MKLSLIFFFCFLCECNPVLLCTFLAQKINDKAPSLDLPLIDKRNVSTWMPWTAPNHSTTVVFISLWKLVLQRQLSDII